MIRGEQVYLRAVETEDVERTHAWVNDEEVTAALTMRHPISRLRETEWI